MLHLTAYRHKGFYGNSYTQNRKISVHDVLDRVQKVEMAETDITRNQLMRNGIQFISGSARFLDHMDNKTIAVLNNDEYTDYATDAQRHNKANVCKRYVCFEMTK